MKFKIGEIAILIKNHYGPRNVECEIIGYVEGFEKTFTSCDYKIKVPGQPCAEFGKKYWICYESNLKKLPPHTEAGSFDAIKDIWQPKVLHKS